MLPVGALAWRVARPHGPAVGIRWFRFGKYRKRAAAAAWVHPPEAHRGASTGRPPWPRAGGGRHSAAGYCSGPRGAKNVVPFLLADIGEGISEVTVKEWYVNVGDRVAEFDDICEVESDKATVTITSRFSGAVVRRHYETGGLARVGSALVDIETDGDGETVAVAEAAAAAAASAEVDDGIAAEEPSTRQVAPADRAVDVGGRDANRVLTTPAVRRIAAEKSIDLTTVRGTGKHGRVLKEDLLEWSPSPSVIADSGAGPSPTSGARKPISLTGYAKTMVHSMETSNKIPTFVITDEVDLTRLVELKAQLLPHVRLTLLPFLMKATSLALARHPIVNSTAGPDIGTYWANDSHNIGVAIDTPLGLAVPNIKDVQTLAVVQIAQKLAELRSKAEKGKLTPADVTGGTLTLSNMGSIMGSVFRPMVVPTEVAIGALGRMKYRPRYNACDQLVRTPVMDVSWAADHRLLDGGTLARFFKDWRTYVENPSLILADVELQ